MIEKNTAHTLFFVVCDYLKGVTNQCGTLTLNLMYARKSKARQELALQTIKYIKLLGDLFLNQLNDPTYVVIFLAHAAYSGFIGLRQLKLTATPIEERYMLINKQHPPKFYVFSPKLQHTGTGVSSCTVINPSYADYTFVMEQWPEKTYLTRLHFTYIHFS